MRIAIIGGGISGLAAAHRLTELLPHAELALFEATGRLGGILDTARRDDFLLERSADSFQTKLPYAVDLCRRLGIADKLLPTDDARRRALVVRSGLLLPVPTGFYLMSPRRLGPILRSPILSLRGKLRLLLEPFIPRGPAATILNSEPGTLNPFPDESIAAFASRRLGRETFERLVQPLVAGIFTGDATRLSMAATLPEFVNCERQFGSLLRATLGRDTNPPPQYSEEGLGEEALNDRDRFFATHSSDAASGARYGLFAAPPGGMASLVAAIAGHLPPNAVKLNTPISRITRRSDNRWQLTFDSSTPPSTLHPPPSTFDAIILATPTHAAASILARTNPTLSAALAEIEYASCTIVSLACRRAQIAHPLDSFGFVVPTIENRPIIAASFASQKFPGRAPADGILIRVFIGGALAPQLADLPDDDLVRLAREELAELIELRGEPVWADIARWPRSMPQYHVGHIDRVDHIERLTARHPTLVLAGNAYHGVGIPQCIHSGEQAAERIAAVLHS